MSFDGETKENEAKKCSGKGRRDQTRERMWEVKGDYPPDGLGFASKRFSYLNISSQLERA
jgi:hypothetical protein